MFPALLLRQILHDCFGEVLEVNDQPNVHFESFLQQEALGKPIAHATMPLTEAVPPAPMASQVLPSATLPNASTPYDSIANLLSQNPIMLQKLMQPGVAQAVATISSSQGPEAALMLLNNLPLPAEAVSTNENTGALANSPQNVMYKSSVDTYCVYLVFSINAIYIRSDQSKLHPSFTTFNTTDASENVINRQKAPFSTGHSAAYRDTPNEEPTPSTLGNHIDTSSRQYVQGPLGRARLDPSLQDDEIRSTSLIICLSSLTPLKYYAEQSTSEDCNMEVQKWRSWLENLWNNLVHSNR